MKYTGQGSNISGVPDGMLTVWRRLLARVDALETDVAEVVVKHGDRLDELEQGGAKAECEELAQQVEAKDRTISHLNRNIDTMRNLLGGVRDPISEAQDIREALGLEREATPGRGIGLARAVHLLVENRPEQPPTVLKTAQQAAAFRRGQDAERDAIMEWLRSLTLSWAAGAIANGEHVKPTTPAFADDEWRTFGARQPKAGQVVEALVPSCGIFEGKYAPHVATVWVHSVAGVPFTDEHKWRPAPEAS